MRFALVGNPNSGKTTLFNALTGSTAHVGNWPGVTVDKREGEYKKLPEKVDIIDLPGIYSMSPYTPEEVISRDFVLKENPDCIINIVDCTNLERNLYLTTQLLELDTPVVVALNMSDVLQKNGDKIDIEALEKAISVPVVAISALKEKGIAEVMERGYKAAQEGRKGFSPVEESEISSILEKCKELYSEETEPLFHAVKMVERDELEEKNYPEIAKTMKPILDEYKKKHEDFDFECAVADIRYKYITKHFAGTVTKKERKEELTKSDKIDKVLTHRVWGIPIFLVILFLMFHLTFSSNLLFIGSALGEGWVSLEGTVAEGLFGEGGIASPGVFLQNLLTWGTDSLTEAIRGGMEGAASAEWAVGFVCDGIFGGLFSVLSFLPQILLLFLFFSILEDSGYMARVAFILDRIFRKFGLSGRSFMPMIMGFGCSVPAMINTRTLADERERTATIRVIPFFSCGAKLPILVAIAGALATGFGIGNADLITYGMYVLGMVVAICSVILMRNTTMKGEVPPFIMELPAYHAPQFKNLMAHLWDKLKHFVKKAFTIILVSTILIWFVSHFSFDWHYLPDAEMNGSILAGIGKLIQPIFTPLGFGSQLGRFGWVFAVAAFTGLIAKENVIATFGTLASCIVAGFEADEALAGVDSVTQLITTIAGDIGTTPSALVPMCIAFIAFNMLTIPCFAAVATAKAELPSKKSFKMTLLFWVVTSYVVSMMIYLIGSWWWTLFIFLAIWAAVITLIVLTNKGKIDWKAVGDKLKIKKRQKKVNTDEK